MSKKEVISLEVIKILFDKKINQGEAGVRLGLSKRQVRRLLRSYQENGEARLISKKRGKASNNKISIDLFDKVVELISLKYNDFGPTLACEKLFELDNIKLSRESIRKIMIKSGIWKAKRIKHKPIFQLRERRACSGELIQADASPHDCFEGRRDKCALIVYIDDATIELMKLKFFELETTMAYAEVLQEYIHEFGRFRALYTDRHSIFKVTKGN